MTTARDRVFSTTHGQNREAFTAADWGRFAAVGLIWGSSFLLIAEGLEAFRPGLITWLRILVGAAVIWLVPGTRRPIDRADRQRLVAISFLWVAIPFTLFPLAQQWVSSAATGMLNGAVPILAALAGSLMSRSLPTRGQMVGLVLGSAGVTMIALSTADVGSSQALGVGLLLVATLCYGIAIPIAVPVQQKYGSLPVVGRMLVLGAIWTAPFGLWSTGARRSR